MNAPRKNATGAGRLGREKTQRRKGDLDLYEALALTRSVIAAAFADPNLTPRAQRLVVAAVMLTLSYCRTKDKLSLSQLAAFAGMDLRAARRVWASLEAAGYCGSDGGGRGVGHCAVRWLVIEKFTGVSATPLKSGQQDASRVVNSPRLGGSNGLEKSGPGDPSPERSGVVPEISGTTEAGFEWPASSSRPEQPFAQLAAALKPKPVQIAEAAPIPAPEPPPPKHPKPKHPPTSAGERARWKAALDQVATKARRSASWMESGADLELLAWGAEVHAWHSEEGAGRRACGNYGTYILDELKAADPTVSKFTVHTPGGQVSVESTPAEAAA